MSTYIEKALELKYPPLAVFHSPLRPVGAEELQPQCAMLLVAQAAKGKHVAMNLSSCRCTGAANGFGLEDFDADRFPGGRDCFMRFLSTGNKDCAEGQAVFQQMKEAGASKIMLEEFAEGEGFLKSPELVAAWAESLPKYVPGGAWAVIKPLRGVGGGAAPKAVTFLADPNQLSALVALANYPGPGVDRVRIPFGSGCQCIGLYAFHEADKEHPRAIVGLTDISARLHLGKALGCNILSFTAPWRLYQEMEANAPESFLSRFAWKKIMGQDN